MRKAILLAAAFLFSCGSSGYIASEYSSRSVLAGKPTVKPVQAPVTKQATTQLGTSIGVNIVGGFLLSKWAESKERELLRKYYAVCMIEHNLKKESEDYCANVWANDKMMEILQFKHKLNYGKCKKKWFGMFSAFRKCYREAVDSVKNLHTNWKEELRNILFYDKLIDCLPDPAGVKTNKEFIDTYNSCNAKAENYANEELKKILKEIGEEDG